MDAETPRVAEMRYTCRAMVKGIEAAVAKLKEDPEHPVTAEVDGLIIEMRYKGRRTAADALREIEPLDDESAEEMLRAIREAREEARKLEAVQPPTSRLGTAP
jgi:hypothetical protein